MTSLSYLNVQINTKTMLISYMPDFQVIHTIAYSQQQLKQLINSKLEHYSILILYSQDKKDILTIKDKLISKQKIEQLGKQALEQEKDRQLLDQIAEDSQNFTLQKASNLLQSMIRKTEAKVYQVTANWTLNKIQSQVKKYEKLKQTYQPKAQTGDKKAKKNLKATDKKIQKLQQKRKQLQESFNPQTQTVVKKLPQYSSSSQSDNSEQSLLCR